MGSNDIVDIDTAFIETLDQRLADMPRRPTSYEIIKQLAPTIAEVHAWGHNFQAIAKLLADAGLHLAPATIRTYLRRIRREALLVHPDNGQSAQPDLTCPTSTRTVTKPTPT